MAPKINKVAGDWDDAYPHIILPLPKALAVTLVKGDYVIVDTTTDPWTFKKHTATALLKGPMGLVIDNPINASDLKFSALVYGLGYGLVEGTATQPYDSLQLSDANVNHLEPFVQTNPGGAYNEAEQDAQGNDFLRKVARYLGKPGEIGAGTPSKITAATNTVAGIWIGGGLW